MNIKSRDFPYKILGRVSTWPTDPLKHTYSGSVAFVANPSGKHLPKYGRLGKTHAGQKPSLIRSSAVFEFHRSSDILKQNFRISFFASSSLPWFTNAKPLKAVFGHSLTHACGVAHPVAILATLRHWIMSKNRRTGRSCSVPLPQIWP